LDDAPDRHLEGLGVRRHGHVGRHLARVNVEVDFVYAVVVFGDNEARLLPA
jgi:hypothetical protein